MIIENSIEIAEALDKGDTEFYGIENDLDLVKSIENQSSPFLKDNYDNVLIHRLKSRCHKKLQDISILKNSKYLMILRIYTRNFQVKIILTLFR